MKRLVLFFVLILSVLGSKCLAQSAVLRVGDTVDIRLSGVSDPAEISAFSAPQTIDDGGMLNIPYIGKVKIGGLDCSDAQHFIESKLIEGKIYTKPNITINVGNRFVNATGEVKTPGRLPYTADMTLMTAISAAGGFSDFADKKHVKLVRNGKVQSIDATKITKDPALDVKVIPGDQITVLQSGMNPFN